MRASTNLPLYSLILLFLSTFAVAWPWPRWLPELDSLVVRQDSGDSATPTTASARRTSSSDSSSPSETGKSSTTIKSFSNTKGGTTATGTQSGSKTSSQSGAKTTKKATTTFDARLPAGGVSMITPAPLSTSFYKIGDYVTFAWNYTSLLATPSQINIVATCTANQQLYTLAANQTVGNATGAVTWDTGAYQQTALSAPLLTETYTLIIYDAASSISATPQAGYLSTFNTFTFGMYVPQPYTPLDEFVCITCSGALGDMERRALGMVIGVSAITILSFTWFVGGTGIIW
ncbi:hypothetical protein B0O99DRAFT_618782 [Bisporella sp. PMI_857]|nr:hypothetical protein B0O99DRAFT_618782 [Bisporella sp. PMI_857]